MTLAEAIIPTLLSRSFLGLKSGGYLSISTGTLTHKYGKDSIALIFLRSC